MWVCGAERGVCVCGRFHMGRGCLLLCVYLFGGGVSEREREKLCVGVCLFVCVKERERECICVGEKERERYHG